MKNDARIFASLAQNSNPVPVISIDNLPRFTPLFMARRSATWSPRTIRYRFIRGSTVRKWLPLPTVHLNHINELRLVVLIGAIFTNLWLVSYALLLGSGELFWRHSLDLLVPIWPHDDALEGHQIGSAAGFRDR